MAERRCEWTLWKGWCGSPRLIAHIARVAIAAVAESGGANPDCEIAVHVDGDVERFVSPTDFRKSVSEEALRRFTCLSARVRAPDESVEVSLDLARKQHPEHSWLEQAVLLEVSAPSDSKVAIESVQRQIAAAVGRGARGSERGEIKTQGENPEQAMLARSAQVRRDQILGVLLILAGGAFLAAMVWLAWKDQGLASAPALALFLGGGLIGAAPGLVVAWFIPSFEISEETRSDRALRSLYRGLGPVLGAVAGVVLKVLAG